MDGVQTLINSIIAAGAAIFASYLTNKANIDRIDHQMKLEHQKEEIKKIQEMREQIYHAIYNWTGTTTSRHIAFTSLLNGNTAWDDYLEYIKNVHEDPDISVAIIEYRVNTYFPELVPNWETLMEAFRGLASIYVLYTTAKNHGKEKELDLNETAKMAIQFFVKSSNDFKKQILSSAA